MNSCRREFGKLKYEEFIQVGFDKKWSGSFYHPERGITKQAKQNPLLYESKQISLVQHKKAVLLSGKVSGFFYQPEEVDK